MTPRCSAQPYRGRQAARPDTGATWAPVAPRAAAPGAILGLLVAPQPRGAWPTAAEGWWPPPRTVAPAQAAALWDQSFCPHCRQWRAFLLARRILAPGDELTVARRPTWIYAPAPPHWAQLEITYDGSTRSVGEHRVSGAAAVLWGPPSEHGRPILQIGSISLPEVTCADIAEAHAAALAMQLFARAVDRGWHKVAIHAGDSPLIQRYMASRGRILRSRVQRLLDRALGAASAAGREPVPILIPRRHNLAAHNAAHLASGRAGAAAAANDITSVLVLDPLHIPAPRDPDAPA